MNIKELQDSVKEKSKQIEILRIIMRAIRKYQEQRQSRNEKYKLESFEREMK